jgi:hypothetical protein
MLFFQYISSNLRKSHNFKEKVKIIIRLIIPKKIILSFPCNEKDKLSENPAKNI